MRDYRRIQYAPRRTRQRRADWLLAIVLISCLFVVFRIDGAAIEDCNGNEDCISAVLPH